MACVVQAARLGCAFPVRVKFGEVSKSLKPCLCVAESVTASASLRLGKGDTHTHTCFYGLLTRGASTSKMLLLLATDCCCSAFEPEAAAVSVSDVVCVVQAGKRLELFGFFNCRNFQGPVVAQGSPPGLLNPGWPTSGVGKAKSQTIRKPLRARSRSRRDEEAGAGAAGAGAAAARDADTSTPL